MALDRSLTRASDQSTKDLQRSHLIGQQKELRAAIEAMRKDLEALPSRDSAAALATWRRRLQLAAAANHTVTLASPRLGLSHGLASWLVDWSSVNVGTVSTVPIASLVMQSPTGVAVSEDTLSVFVGDFDAGTIVQADIATGVVTRTLDAPSPGLLARSADGRSLWNTDVLSGKLRRLSLETGETSLTVGGGGGFADGNASAAQFDHPLGVALGVKAGEDVLYVADSGNHRIRRVDFAAADNVREGTVGEDVVLLPTVAAAVVCMYNVDNVGGPAGSTTGPAVRSFSGTAERGYPALRI